MMVEIDRSEYVELLTMAGRMEAAAEFIENTAYPDVEDIVHILGLHCPDYLKREQVRTMAATVTKAIVGDDEE